ncbi:MAG: CDP-diacylglycerol--glycerol-3-phosphate 3-phosphatidyltransferase [Deltaproteobacteria bacterium]|nr:CDP-diacylglycerol--glycerol-3-phosphate 3-phosphatidyltransferase [Deltaproteobacteria bacterium]
MNLPNTLTILRILAIPVFVICLLYNRFFLALLIFIGAGITDGLDGLIARFCHQRTVIGAYLDPIADKLMLTTAFIVLAVLGIIPSWLTVIVIARDVIILLGILILHLTSHQVKINPIFLGKTSTVLQIVTIAWALLTPSSVVMKALFPAIIWVTAGLIALSGLHYIYIGTKYFNE